MEISWINAASYISHNATWKHFHWTFPALSNVQITMQPSVFLLPREVNKLMHENKVQVTDQLCACQFESQTQIWIWNKKSSLLSASWCLPARLPLSSSGPRPRRADMEVCGGGAHRYCKQRWSGPWGEFHHNHTSVVITIIPLSRC